jgi:ppGpp synthetase/RelA/SpoT-type nucleotidyltranferase
MKYPSILDRQYQQCLPFVEEVAKRVKSTLVNFCDKEGYAFTSRIKTIESLAEKIETGRFKRWSDLDDLFACTVIIPRLSQEQDVIDFCRNSFNVTKTLKRGQAKKSPEVFRFDSTRISGKLRSTDTSLDPTFNIFNIGFEIQIKSAFEHAWAVSTHDLVYKSSEIDWKKLRLAAQIKSTVEQLDTLILAFETVADVIQESDYPELKKKIKIGKLTNSLFENKIPEELRPKDLSRFCDNLYRILVSAGKDENIQESLDCIKSVINRTSTKKIPRSISLLQYFFAILVENQIITLPLPNYSCHITQELITLYPFFDTQNSISFDYET